jgi:4-hydroxy-tetrahydrodipicolinate reductase
MQQHSLADAPSTAAYLVLGEHGKMADAVYRHLLSCGQRCERQSLRHSLAPLETFAQRMRGENTTPIVVDFTNAALTESYVHAPAAQAVRWVIGTSGLRGPTFVQLAALAQRTSVFYASNFSRGIAQVSKWLETFDPECKWECEIVDLHHRFKLDRPSATSIQLANSWTAARPDAPQPNIASLRIGDGVSEHTVVLARRGERVEIKHLLLDRGAFLLGIEQAIALVSRRERGLFGMPDLFDAAGA